MSSYGTRLFIIYCAHGRKLSFLGYETYEDGYQSYPVSVSTTFT